MMIDTMTHEQAAAEAICQMLECSGACLLLACPDTHLRHPVLDFWSAYPLMTRVGSLAQIDQESIECEEVKALRDLALQSASILIPLESPATLLRWGIQSIAILPLERPAGLLGTLVLVDERPQWFGQGEQSLLHAALPIYTCRLEEYLRQQMLHSARKHSQPEDGNAATDTATDPFPRTEFVAMVSHELRAPLSIIKGYAGLLQIYGDATEPVHSAMTLERQQRYLAEIMEQTTLLELLINDLLDISQLQHGKLILRPGPIEVKPFCQQIIQLGQMRAHQLSPGRHHLICRVAEQLPPISADKNRLRQIFLNLLENAIKYSPEGGNIELVACWSDDWPEAICLTVRDNGIGIPDLQQAHLFQPFERLERPAIAHIAGNGLGLYLANKLVEAMAGKIEVKSKQSCGTIVSITLPISKICNSSCAKEHSLL